MKHIIRRLVVTTVAFVAVSLSARAADDDEALHESLRALRATYEKAVSSGDLTPLQPLFAPETSAVMTLGTEVKNFDELKQHWAYVRSLIGESGSYATTLNPEPSLLLGDIALARGTADDVVKTGDGREFRFQSKWTAVCQRNGTQWKVLRLHASMDPVTNVFVAAFQKRTKLVYGLGGIAIGVLAGIIVGRLTKRSA